MFIFTFLIRVYFAWFTLIASRKQGFFKFGVIFEARIGFRSVFGTSSLFFAFLTVAVVGSSFKLIQSRTLFFLCAM
jgi:hypothetical protein